MIDIQERVDALLNGELKWSVSKDKLIEIMPLIQRLTKGEHYIGGTSSKKYNHIYCKAIPFWQLTGRDVKQLKKYEKQLIKEQLLKEREAIDKLLIECE